MTADGTRLTIRLLAVGDGAALAAFVRRLSFGSRYFRYGSPDFALSYEQAQSICAGAPDGGTHLMIQARQCIVASGRIVCQPGQRHCELEMVVADSWQRQGLGWRLLDALIDAARRRPLREMRARVLVTNTPMLSLLRRRGFVVDAAEAADAIYMARLDLCEAAAAPRATRVSTHGAPAA